MIINPRWLDWLEEDSEGNLTVLKPDTPKDIKEEYETLLQEEKKNIEENKFAKKWI